MSIRWPGRWCDAGSGTIAPAGYGSSRIAAGLCAKAGPNWAKIARQPYAAKSTAGKSLARPNLTAQTRFRQRRTQLVLWSRITAATECHSPMASTLRSTGDWFGTSERAACWQRGFQVSKLIRVCSRRRNWSGNGYGSLCHQMGSTSPREAMVSSACIRLSLDCNCAAWRAVVLAGLCGSAVLCERLWKVYYSGPLQGKHWT